MLDLEGKGKERCTLDIKQLHNEDSGDFPLYKNHLNVNLAIIPADMRYFADAADAAEAADAADAADTADAVCVRNIRLCVQFIL